MYIFDSVCSGEVLVPRSDILGLGVFVTSLFLRFRMQLSRVSITIFTDVPTDSVHCFRFYEDQRLIL